MGVWRTLSFYWKLHQFAERDRVLSRFPAVDSPPEVAEDERSPEPPAMLKDVDSESSGTPD